MALGTISVLLIIVTGVANIFINEMKLSRTLYDDTVANLSAEWVFEYAMLKVRNHREWFSDSLVITDPDAKMFHLDSDRSRNLKIWYTLEANSTDKTFTIAQNDHLILPLFAAQEAYIGDSTTSKKPAKNTSITKVRDLSVSGIADMSWTIIAQKGTESIGLSGSGVITAASIGSIRERSADCYDTNGDKLINCQELYAEILEYYFDTASTVGEFLSREDINDPYLMLYNPNLPKEVRIQSNPVTPFALPLISLESTAQKNDSLQVYRFEEDKSRYFETLKYGIYNNE